ncbi:50S ribosomal protein L10 [Candidatus Adlerbacteria bacterium RIFCSPLOWO2_01_FULL_51_16]|uniref:Large ribosomal subunit protein uL10 n=1 Tax=Candidatus Adlerbacteria bacterium RIFCSPLOWO2_01_FULL_51_16 TaxID=1797243 RepID=A0A1F4XHK4_9BACT|nr:MAG: 50S ribosomal protein L10 [Candidatus Adlerbacteria bacterium RIFCSPLOWO2_01_FULL_51_16]
MAITRQKKEEVVAKAQDIFAKAKTVVFANFKGLTVAEVSELRKTLRAQGVGYSVAKKTLLRRALLGTKIEGTLPALEGEIAIAHGEDELAPARELAVFIKKFSGHLAFVGGIFGGKFVDKAEITSISAIPGMETLRAQFVQLINSPIQRFAVVMSEIAKTKK